jgi:hypothetical protein
MWDYVGSGTEQTQREKKVVVLRGLYRAIMNTTEMSKQLEKNHVRMQFTVYLVNKVPG